MSGILKEMREEAYAEGRSEERTEMIENMLKDGRTVEEIVNFCKLPEDIVRQIEKRIFVTM